MTYYQTPKFDEILNKIISLSDFEDKSRLYIRHSNSWLRFE